MNEDGKRAIAALFLFGVILSLVWMVEPVTSLLLELLLLIP